jgi:2-polyprenyl-3-methyl-5-hydroxy-6-metoxy-1,4-benzoquinol methylase
MFKNRSTTKELLDGENIPQTDLYQNLKELDIINNLLGGYKITFDALKKVFNQNQKNILVDIGSGGGNTLKQIQQWNIKQNFDVKLYGIDLKQTCIDFSLNNNNSEINFICDDYRNVLKHVANLDVMHACLFCHHLTEQEIIELINFCIQNKITLVINDLERNAFAYYSIKILTTFFSKSYLVKNDAPLSVLRGFKLHEWKSMINKSTAKNYSVKNKWAFRHEVIIYGK